MHTTNIEEVTALWLETSLCAHDFIDGAYWRDNQHHIKNVLLPRAETFVYIDKHQIKGFISIIDDNYIGALFVASKYQKQGIGRKLLEYIRRQSPNLSLRVYVKNHQAISFYQNNSFKIIAETIDEKTQEKELLVAWARGCMSGNFHRTPGDS